MLSARAIQLYSQLPYSQPCAVLHLGMCPLVGHHELWGNGKPQSFQSWILSISQEYLSASLIPCVYWGLCLSWNAKQHSGMWDWIITYLCSQDVCERHQWQKAQQSRSELWHSWEHWCQLSEWENPEQKCARAGEVRMQICTVQQQDADRRLCWPTLRG